MTSAKKSSVILNKHNILQDLTNNPNCVQDLNFWVKGQNVSAGRRNWEGLDTKPMITKEICTNKQDENFTKFTHHSIDKEFYCTNFTKAEFSRDLLYLYDYHNILIEQCNNTALCITRAGTAENYVCQLKEIYNIENYLNTLPLLASIALPIIGALSYYFSESTGLPFSSFTTNHLEEY